MPLRDHPSSDPPGSPSRGPAFQNLARQDSFVSIDLTEADTATHLNRGSKPQTKARRLKRAGKQVQSRQRRHSRQQNGNQEQHDYQVVDWLEWLECHGDQDVSESASQAIDGVDFGLPSTSDIKGKGVYRPSLHEYSNVPIKGHDIGLETQSGPQPSQENGTKQSGTDNDIDNGYDAEAENDSGNSSGPYEDENKPFYLNPNEQRNADAYDKEVESSYDPELDDEVCQTPHGSLSQLHRLRQRLEIIPEDSDEDEPRDIPLSELPGGLPIPEIRITDTSLDDPPDDDSLYEFHPMMTSGLSPLLAPPSASHHNPHYSRGIDFVPMPDGYIHTRIPLSRIYPQSRVDRIWNRLKRFGCALRPEPSDHVIDARPPSSTSWNPFVWRVRWGTRKADRYTY
ncbi:hypothetical protein GGR57DRAFT_503122 [Xylariaceae sp. FL1272]|nr:hypothetical protein GGR57DRAFT_503122 [Xylariaceae sp. FL1272]